MPIQEWTRVADGIYRRSSGTLYERPLISKRPTWRSLGTQNLKIAREELHKRRVKGQEAYSKPIAVNTGQVIRCYEKDGYPDRHKQPRQERTLRVERDNCKKLLEFWEHVATEAVTLAVCDRYHEWRTKHIKRGSGNRTVDMELTTLSNAFLWASRKELVRSNPMSIYRPRYCSDKNVQHCREFMPNNADEVHRIAELLFASLRSETLGWQLLIEAATGLRTIEALQLRTDAKPYEAGWLTSDGKSLCVRRAKNQQTVNPFVQVHEGLAAILTAHRRWKEARYPESPWYFPNLRDPLKHADKQALTHVMCRLRNEIGRKITSHGLRAFYVTTRRSHAIPDNQIAWEIGHTSGGQTLASVYGGAPPHWLAGDGPKMSWLPAGKPAWENRWPLGGGKITLPTESESKTKPPEAPTVLALPAVPPHPVQNKDDALENSDQAASESSPL